MFSKNLSSWRIISIIALAFSANLSLHALEAPTLNRKADKELLLSKDTFHPIPGVHDLLSALILEKEDANLPCFPGMR